MSVSDQRVGIFPKDKIMVNQITHVCVVVKDVERTANKLAEFGIGPFEIREKHYPPSKASVRGEPTEYTLKFAYAKAGPITLELAQTVKGKTMYQEFLEKHGEGIHHIGFSTPLPFEDELAKWEQNGIKPLQVSRLNDPEEGWAYMDTEKLIGFTLEILSFRKYQ